MTTVNNRVRIIVELVDQPPFDTKAAVTHRSVIVENEVLATLLRSYGNRVIAAVPEQVENSNV